MSYSIHRLSIETLLSLDFSPQRTTVLAFGFDEEISGRKGAAKIAVYLEETYGTEGFSILIDEGYGMFNMFGARFASPAVGEKGYMDVRIEVTTPGGHSSIPPANQHTVCLFHVIRKEVDMLSGNRSTLSNNRSLGE
jgi:Gly-Xaa carboxypeptidase